MKGHFFKNGIEYNILVDGEMWPQGGHVQGHLTIKNLSENEISLENFGVSLSFADFKSIHERDHSALTLAVLNNTQFEKDVRLKVKEEKKILFHFSLDINCPITDKKESLFLTYGENFLSSHLQLITHPHHYYVQIKEILERFFRFKFVEFKNEKNAKNKNNKISMKFKAPQSREFTNLQQLEVLLSWDKSQEPGISLELIASINKIDAKSAVTKIKKEKVTFDHFLPLHKYTLTKESIDQEKVCEILKSSIDKFKLNTF